jgi:protein-disulfide isomerase
MRLRPISRRLALGGGIGAVVVTGSAVGQLLAQPRAAAAADIPVDADALFHDPEDPVIGNSAGTLPLVEFFDYRCPFCRRMHPLLQRLLTEDHGIRFIAKEWPIFGGPSVTAARIALAANWQGKFKPVHDALFEAGPLDDQRIRGVAEKAGVDMVRLQRNLSARSDELDRALADVAGQARSLGLQGTPGFVIGSYFVPSALSYGELVKVVADARAEQKPTTRGENG